MKTFEENTFNFTAHLNPMSAREFNSLLEATAYVSVESGSIKDIKLKASGDKHYAIGKMTFQYNDLKVSTINKKNLKTAYRSLIAGSYSLTLLFRVAA